MKTLKLLIEMGYTITFIPPKYKWGVLIIELSKNGETMSYDDSLFMSNPQSIGNLTIGGLLIQLHKEMVEEK